MIFQSQHYLNFAKKLAFKKCVQNSLMRTYTSTEIGLPCFGLGCYKMEKHETERSILTAVEAGYRFFDTAQSYENEENIGNAIKVSGLKRTEFFISTKLSTKHGYQETRESLLKSLEFLKVDYVDMYLIHSPSKGKIIETWDAFKDLRTEGYTKRIGVSNFNIQHLEGLLSVKNYIPDVNQIEYHPWHQLRPLVKYCNGKGIFIMGYCPLARMQLIPTNQDHILSILALKYKKAMSQILLRWSVQKGVITIPKSVTDTRIKENIQIFDFHLNDQEMKRIDDLDCGHQIASINAINEPWTG